MRITVDKRGRVDLRAESELPMSAEAAWRWLRDFRRFACQDLFHRVVELEAAEPRAGAAFRLKHEFAGIHVWRVGRILFWNEGESYAFSDLSQRGPRAGFPHVYTHELLPVSANCCRLRLSVRGRWTATFIPRPLVRLWLAAIMLKTRASMRNALLLSELRERRRPDVDPGFL